MSLIGPVILLMGIVAGILMIATEFSSLFHVKVLTVDSCDTLAEPSQKDACETTGGEQHSYALILVGVLTWLLAYGAGIGGSRPAAVGLVVAGALVLAIALIGDLPDSSKTGAVGQDFEQAKAVQDAGIILEILGGVLAMAAGVAGFFFRRRA